MPGVSPFIGKLRTWRCRAFRSTAQGLPIGVNTAAAELAPGLAQQVGDMLQAQGNLATIAETLGHAHDPLALSHGHLVENMREQVSATWYDVVRAEGVSEKDAEAIRGAFVYEGFNGKATGSRSPCPHLARSPGLTLCSFLLS